MKSIPATVPAIAAMLVVVPQAAHAYIGPGAGISALGTAFALLGGLALAIVGFVWYPIKRLRGRLRKRVETGEGPVPS